MREPDEAAWRTAGGRYRLIELAGVGGMATVWHAFDPVLGRKVAIKVPSAGAADEELLRSMRHEAQAVAALSHPHVTAVYDFGEDILPDGRIRPYVVMELLDGLTLAEVLSGETALPWQQAVTITRQVASALAAAHARGLVHRDITTSNIMVTADGVKILDFGIAALLGEQQEGLVGTPAFVAPERVTDPAHQAAPATDVYALGIVWYRMMAGIMPWPEPDGTEILMAHVKTPPSPFPQHVEAPDLVALLCMRCLSKQPGRRPSAAELATSLAALASGQNVGLAVAPLPADDWPATSKLSWTVKPGDVGIAARRKGRRTVLTAAATAAALFFLGWAFWPTDSDPQAVIVDNTPAPSPIASPLATPTRDSTPTPIVSTVRAPTTRTRPAQASPQPGTVVSALGGTLRVTCDGKTASALSLVPAKGFIIEDYRPGPDSEVKAVLISADHKSEIKVRCADGIPKSEVKESRR